MERCAELDLARSAGLFALSVLLCAAADQESHSAASEAFRRKDYREAASWLHRALRVDPADPYTNDFLATVYFLQGNLDAALRYWNVVGKPRLAAIDLPPDLRTNPVLLDRAFPFAPGSVLRAEDLRTARARIAALEVFAGPAFRLNGRPDRTFDLRFTARERNGWGEGRLHSIVSALRGLGYQAVHPEYFNAGGRGINFTSLLRWDTQKRRVHAAVSAPAARDRVWVDVEAREERWEIPGASRFGLRKIAAGAGFSRVVNGDWQWATGGEMSWRSVGAGSPAPVRGQQLKHTIGLERSFWRVPERRLDSFVQVRGETGRLWAGDSAAFHRLQVSAQARWLPAMQGEDYAVHGSLRAGRIFGQAPWDELFILGLERDNDLPMRAHIGTRDGRKGSAPMGSRYAMASVEMDKNIYSNGLFVLKLSPFLDTGKIGGVLGSRKWLWDTGLQGKVRVLGVGFTVTYGKDLRSGKDVFYVAAGR